MLLFISGFVIELMLKYKKCEWNTGKDIIETNDFMNREGVDEYGDTLLKSIADSVKIKEDRYDST